MIMTLPTLLSTHRRIITTESIPTVYFPPTPHAEQAPPSISPEVIITHGSRLVLMKPLSVSIKPEMPSPSHYGPKGSLNMIGECWSVSVEKIMGAGVSKNVIPQTFISLLMIPPGKLLPRPEPNTICPPYNGAMSRWSTDIREASKDFMSMAYW